MIVEGVRMSLPDWLAYKADIALYGNGFISVAHGGNVGLRMAPEDVQIKNHARYKTGLKR